MDIKQQAITEYLTQGIGYRQLAAKYGVSRTTICKWVQIHQGIHNIAPTEKQQKYYLSGMNSKPDNTSSEEFKNDRIRIAEQIISKAINVLKTVFYVIFMCFDGYLWTFSKKL